MIKYKLLLEPKSISIRVRLTDEIQIPWTEYAYSRRMTIDIAKHVGVHFLLSSKLKSEKTRDV